MLLDKEFISSKYLKAGVVPVTLGMVCLILVRFTRTYQPDLFFLCVQPIRLGDHLNSILLGMCEDVIYARVSVRTVLDACSAHIRNSSCAPSFSYVKQLVKLVLGNLSGVSHSASWYTLSYFKI